MFIRDIDDGEAVRFHRLKQRFAFLDGAQMQKRAGGSPFLQALPPEERDPMLKMLESVTPGQRRSFQAIVSTAYASIVAIAARRFSPPNTGNGAETVATRFVQRGHGS